ncbi:MAG: hypothetical protein D6788_05915 [Planctomycetota bacterium]|nr:MAG: hypothetical protein D6788_05915 [Planctomycetota bacterium]
MDDRRILAVEDIELKARAGLTDRFRWFYGEICRLEEVPGRADRRVQVCFRSGPVELRILTAPDPRPDPIPCRATILVPSLVEAAAQLDEAKTPYEWIRGLSFTDRRLEVLDPGGYRIALRTWWGPGLLPSPAVTRFRKKTGIGG